jgi:REP element-mobilizing transposase RayT
VSSTKTNNVTTENDAGGTGVPPVHSFQVTRRNLPHMQEPERVYFITWRCRDGEILSPEERALVLDSLSYWEGRKWSVLAAVIMPNHLHALVRCLPHPDGGVFDLAEILHSVKSFTAHQIMKQRGTPGKLWQDERYDRIVRDEAEFLEKWHYIRNNPVRDGLAARPEDYNWLYEKGKNI